MCRASVVTSLQTAGVCAKNVDTILFANSTAGWSAADEAALLCAFNDIGVVSGKIIGLQFQSCSGLGCVLDIARGLLRQGHSSLILIILCGQVKNGMKRLDPDSRTVFGDGAATCIVSARPAGFEVLSTMTLIDPSLIVQKKSSSLPRARFRNLCETIERAYSEAGIGPENVNVVLGTNGNIFYLDLIAEAARVPPDKIYKNDLGKFGHIFSCDNLISLVNYETHNQISPGDHFLVIGWAPFAVGAAVLRAVGAPKP